MLPLLEKSLPEKSRMYQYDRPEKNSGVSKQL